MSGGHASKAIYAGRSRGQEILLNILHAEHKAGLYAQTYKHEMMTWVKTKSWGHSTTCAIQVSLGSDFSISGLYILSSYFLLCTVMLGSCFKFLLKIYSSVHSRNGNYKLTSPPIYNPWKFLHSIIKKWLTTLLFNHFLPSLVVAFVWMACIRIAWDVC